MANNTNRPGFKNIQIQSKIELAELFEDTFQQSGSNSKAEFLGILLNEYLNPDVTTSKKANEALLENEQLKYSLNAALNEKNEILNENSNHFERIKDENSNLTERIHHYENEILKMLFEKHQGKKLKFTSTTGKKVEIEIKEVKDVYTALINSVKV